MRHQRLLLLAAVAVVLTSLLGCRLPGKPTAGHTPLRPDQVTSFDLLYRQNCQACHGVNGRDGTAVSLANPAYLAYAGRAHIQQITANGIEGSLMPGFAKAAGGLLTDEQVQALTNGIVARWANTAALQGAVPPVYESYAVGGVEAGAALYGSLCTRCHAPGRGSILDPTYLALVSNGGLRTWIVAGKTDSGMPDWRGYPGGALTDQQTADLVTFLVSHRTAAPGQPHPAAESPKTVTPDHRGAPPANTAAAAGAALHREPRV